VRSPDAAAPAAPEDDATGAGKVRAAIDAARRGNDASRWPDKLPVADRLAVLLDPGSWREDGLLANATADGLPADGVRTGTGRIDGRPVAVIAHDFAVKAGSWGRLTCEKQVRILERADRVWEDNRGWGGVADIVPEKPSSYFRDHVWGCFFDDAHGLKSVEEIGEDIITYESDYPHSDSTWPRTRQIAEEQMADLTDAQRRKIVRGNAIQLFGLDFVA